MIRVIYDSRIIENLVIRANQGILTVYYRSCVSVYVWASTVLASVFLRVYVHVFTCKVPLLIRATS